MRVPYRFVASRLVVVSAIGATALGLTTAAMGQEAALLSWARRDLNDPMTNKVIVRLASQVNFPNGVTIDAWAKCTEIGMEFALRAFNGDAPALLGWQDKKIQMRVRLGNEGVRVATIFEEYTNEAKAIFYDPNVTSRLVAKDLAGRRTGKPIDPMSNAVLGWLEDAAVQDGMAKLKQAAPGTIAELAKAESVRIELTLADGRTNVVDLNRRDPALNGIIQQCLGNLGHPTQPAGQLDPMAPTIPLAQPKKVALTKPINVYLSTDGNSTATMTGEVLVLGQKQFSDGYLCVVRGKANGQEVSGFIGVEALDAALNSAQWRTCRTLRGAGGVEADDILVTYPFMQPKHVTLKDSITVYDTEDFKSSLRLTGKISVLGQRKFGEKSFYCVVSTAIRGRDVRGLILIGVLHDSLDASERNACYMPRGAGGIEIPQSAAR